MSDEGSTRGWPRRYFGNRLQRFVHCLKLEAEKRDEDDGYVSDDDGIAVLFDVSELVPSKRSIKCFMGMLSR